MLIPTRIAFFEFAYFYKDINKIKILPSWLNPDREENIVKIQTSSNIQLFSMDTNKKKFSLPSSFTIFAKIIEKKLELKNFTIDNKWRRSEHVESSVTKDSYIYGNILKKSQILNNW